MTGDDHANIMATRVMATRVNKIRLNPPGGTSAFFKGVTPIEIQLHHVEGALGVITMSGVLSGRTA